MLARTAEFDQASDGRLNSRPILQIRATRGSTSRLVKVVAGTARLSLDGRADIERSLIFDSVGETPTSPADLQTPYGTTLEVFSGWVHDVGPNRGKPDVLLLATLDVTETTTDTGRVKITAKDYAEGAIAAGFEYPRIVIDGSNLGLAISALLSPLDLPAPTIPPDFSTLTAVQMPQIILGEGSNSNDPWRTAREWATFDGLQLRLAPTGQPWLSRPDTVPTSVYTFASGRNLGAVTRTWRKTPNVVIAHSGSVTNSPVRATAEITDTNSPIHPSRVGRRVIHITSPVLVSVQQCRQAAEAELARGAGRGKIMAFKGRAHGALVPGDVVTVKDDKYPTAELVRLGSWELPLPVTGMVSYTVDTV